MIIKAFHFRLLLICIFIFPVSFAFSQDTLPDSCAKLSFHSSLEREGFEALCSGKHVDFLTMAIAVNPSSDHTTLKNFSGLIEDETIAIRQFMQKQKKLSKSLKFIFDDIQGKFLKAYDLDANFNDLFGNGNFNCLTATILYSVILDKLNIEHSVKFMPGHVYLIAFDGETPYMFETTDPYNGFYQITSQERSKALQGMRLLQFMASDNGQKENGNDLFDRYFIKLNNTDMRGLVGYQYVNEAVTHMIGQRYQQVYDLTSKAMLLTPMDELKVLKEESLIQSLSQVDKTSSKRARLLAEFYNTTTNSNKKNLVADEFKITIYQCIFSAFPKPDSLLPIFETLKNNIQDEDMKMVISDLYTTTYSEYLRSTDNVEEFFDFILKSYSNGVRTNYLKLHIQDMISLMAQGFIYNEDGLKEYDSIALRYPVLSEFDDFRLISCSLWLNKSEEAFRSGKIAEGDEYLAKFENSEFSKNSVNYRCNPAGACSVAASWYFRKGNTAKAKAYLNKGLKYDPNNWELKKKLTEISR